MYEAKNGQKNLMATQLCLCSSRRQMMDFFQKKNILSLKSYLKEFNVNAFFKAAIIFYQRSLSFFLGGNCRYYPSCSHYAIEAFDKYNFLKASGLTFMRLINCQPLSKRNFYDPVPLTPKEMSRHE